MTVCLVAFTITSQNNAIQAAYGFGANLYFVKPENYDLLASSLRRLIAMNWNDPKSIPANYFRNCQYTGFL
jgi:hypothetical protein